MTVKERILALRLAMTIGRQPEYANRIGVSVDVERRNPTPENAKNKEDIK